MPRVVLDSLRTADLVTRIGASELAVALPNTVTADAEIVGRRLAKGAPEAAIGISVHGEGDSVESLLDRARGVAARLEGA
ncbi:MAG: hypothetical protein ACR2GU_04740 [Rubrobacteraceae bacterium]